MTQQVADADFVCWGAEGLLGHAVSAAAGGRGDGFADLIAGHEALGRREPDAGRILALNAHVWGALFPILSNGTPGQRETWLPALVAGEQIGGHAITEPDAGSDLQGLQAAAVATDDGYRLNGLKRWITNTPVADLMVVYVWLDGALSAFVVRPTDPGAAFRDGPTVEGCESAGMGDLVLSDCRLPADRLLGSAGNGTLMVQQALELERAFIFAGIGGLMAAQLAQVVQAARRRRVGGRPLAVNPVIAHRVADMRTRLDTLTLWVRHCAELADAGKRITLASSQTKLFGAEAFLQSSLDAVQILGAAGMQSGEAANRWVRDAMASRLFSGSSELQKNIIAALTGVGGR